jgi:hypothetical protein
MRFFSALMPRERQFFQLFNQHAEFVVHGSKLLQELLENYDDAASRPTTIKRIEDAEKAADRVTRETVQLLHRTFVTPFDREQINRLISCMDDILDVIQDVGETLTLYDIQHITPEATHLANLVVISCARVQSAVALLPSMDNASTILQLCEEIDGLESDADRVMRAAVSKLFREEPDTRQVVKLKAVFQLLEASTDKCQDVANVLEGVVLENG